jgi:Tfp pilus assembly protein PilO
MKKPKSKSRGWALTLILLGALAAYAFLVFLPAQRSLGRLREELQLQREYTAQAEVEYAVYEELDQEFQQVSTFVNQWRGVAPRDGDLPDVLGTISQFATDSGITLRRMNPTGSVDLASIGQDTFQFKIEGRFQSLFKFLRQLESLTGVVWSNDLQLKQGRDDDERLQCQLDLTVFTDNREISD